MEIVIVYGKQCDDDKLIEFSFASMDLQSGNPFRFTFEMPKGFVAFFCCDAPFFI